MKDIDSCAFTTEALHLQAKNVLISTQIQPIFNLTWLMGILFRSHNILDIRFGPFSSPNG